MSIRTFWCIFSLVLLPIVLQAQDQDVATKSSQYITVLGIAQDGGYLQSGCAENLPHSSEDKMSLGLSNQVSAPNTFKAQILDDSSGEPLAGATLYFPQLELGGSSDENGWVSVAAIPDGTCTLLVS